MMIGGGGSGCSGADHGIGITETDGASFIKKGQGEITYDFGHNATTRTQPSRAYALNLWIY